jgi:hypothetical protein
MGTAGRVAAESCRERWTPREDVRRSHPHTATNLGEEGNAKAGFFVFVVLRGVVEFAFSQVV